jgi:hypothetical protein
MDEPVAGVSPALPPNRYKILQLKWLLAFPE